MKCGGCKEDHGSQFLSEHGYLLAWQNFYDSLSPTDEGQLPYVLRFILSHLILNQNRPGDLNPWKDDDNDEGKAGGETDEYKGGDWNEK